MRAAQGLERFRHRKYAEIVEGVRALGLWVAESDANFIWMRLPGEDADYVKGLQERGVLVRSGGALGEVGALRVTVGTDAENRKFLDALAALL